MHIEQHRRARNWADEKPAASARALAAAGAVTATLLLSLGAAQRAPRPVDRMLRVIELQPVVIMAPRAPAVAGKGFAAMAASPQPVLR